MAAGHLQYGMTRPPPQGFVGRQKVIISRRFFAITAANRCILGQSQEVWTCDPAMNISSEMNFEEMLRVKLEVLRREHRDLDEAIHVLETAGRPDPLTLRRLKKQKLALKDQIVKFEDQLIPDIIA